MRKLPLALACALIFGSSSAFAIGLGELQTQSNLNQPLRVTIPITDVRPGDVDALSVKIGDEAQFARHGYSLMSVYGRIKLQIVGGQRPHILLTSDVPVRDPVLGLVLEVTGPSGTIERAVSILLDPEGYKPLATVKSASGRALVQDSDSDSDTQPRSRIYATEKSATPRSVSEQALPPIRDGGDYTAVSGDTAYNIAQRVKPEGVSLQQTIGMILQNNPQAFANPANANTLLAGKTLTIPNAQAMRQAAPAAVVAPKAALAGTAPAAPAAHAAPAAPSEPRLDIVQPTASVAPAVPVIAAPVVGEVVGGAVGAPDSANAAAPQASTIPIEMQEQLEASKVENERLTGLLASQDLRLQKMEELLRLNETLIKEMEQKMSTAPAAPVVPVTAPVEASAPWWSYGLMGLGALLAAVLAYIAGSRRRSKDEPELATVQPVSSVKLDKQAETDLPASLVASSVAVPVATIVDSASADVIEDAADPVKSALEEADVMQAYGLHDRAIQLLSDALQAHPGNAVLMARRARAMHEAGDVEGFLNEAEAFYKQHPGDTEQWAELRALGEAHYPASPLLAAAVLDDEKNPWAQPSSAPAKADEASSPILPLKDLDLGEPDVTLDEFFSSQAVTQSPAASIDMPPLDLDLPLELDLPAVSSVTKAPDAATSSLLDELLSSQAVTQSSAASLDMPPLDLNLPLELDLPAVSNTPKRPDDAASVLGATADAKIADLSDAWAALELPSMDSALPAINVKTAPRLDGELDISAEDLAILGIDAEDIGSDVMAQKSVTPLSSESDFSQDLQAAQSELVALSLESAPLSLNEPARDLPSLSLETDAVSDALADSAIKSPLELPLSAPIASIQEALVPASLPSSGMMSEHEVKLDIASAYIDMGDQEGAREMLQEILSSDGDELLKHRASQILNTLSA